MRKQKLTIIEQKAAHLKELQAQSDGALDIVTSTIDSLIAINEEIDDTISEIQDMKKSLDATESDLNATRARNNKIADKFRALIEA